MNIRNAILLSLILMPISHVICAQDQPQGLPQDRPQEPPPPAGYPADEQPQVTIIQRGTETIEEYRINGRLYMIKVTPKKGVPYYLIDTTGNGTFDTRTELTQDLRIPGWILLKW